MAERSSLLIVLALSLAGELNAHPPPSGPPVTRRSGQDRIPMRINRPPQVAPDNQTEPLEIGSVAEIDVSQRVTINVKVVDANTEELLPHRVHIDDANGNYYPPEGHFDIEPAAWNTNNVSYEPDTINDGYDWAMIPRGEFKVHVRARNSIQMKFAHGLEYPITTVSLDLAEMAGKTIEKTLSLERGIDMRRHGWMSADTHVHNLTPLGAIRQMPVEAIDYVNLMFIGPRHPLYRRDFLTGKPADASTDDHIIYLSQEVRDANQGHMTLLGLKTPITPIRIYTGVEQVIRLAPLPNEPLNWEVYDHLHAEGGLAYHAHYLYWPGWGSPVGAAINKLDGLEWLQTDIASRDDRTRQNIEVPGYGKRAAGRMWYDMLNCGAKLPLVGGTDKMNAGRVVGGSCRTYIKVPEWTHEGFLAGLRTGETFVTNAPLLHLTANDMPIGSELKFQGDGPFTVKVKTGCFTQRPVKYFEIIVNGVVVAQVDVAKNQKTVEISKEIPFRKSGWIAVRARHDKSDPDNWHHTITAAHSSPIYVTINDQLPAVNESADYLVARMDATLQWAESDARWSSDAYRRKAISSFQQSKKFYEAASERAHSNDQPSTPAKPSVPAEGNQATATTIAQPEVWLCAGDRLADLLRPDAQWPSVSRHLSGIKFYVGQLSKNGRPAEDTAEEKLRQFATLVRAHDLQVAVELGGCLEFSPLDDSAGEWSARRELAAIENFYSVGGKVDFLDIDGPIRRLMHPKNRKDGKRFESIEKAAGELVDALRIHRTAHPETRYWLLTNFPNWGWRGDVSYHARGRNRQDYGDYDQVVRIVLGKLKAAEIPLDGVTVDNPYDYLTGAHRSVNLADPTSVDWLARVRSYENFARDNRLTFNLIVNSERGGQESDERFYRETLQMVDAYLKAGGKPTRWFVQSWYPFPKEMTPESAPHSMMALVKAVIARVRPDVRNKQQDDPPREQND